MPKLLLQDTSFSIAAERLQAVKNAFIQTHALIEAESIKNPQFNADLAGCSATFVLHDVEYGTLLVAHVGDSTCCLGGKEAVAGGPAGISVEQLTEGHKPELPEEKLRIEKAGGEVKFDGHATHRVFAKGKVYPGMAMSRALGDVQGHKEAGIIAEPTVKEVLLGDNDQVLLLCSDGVWEFVSPQEAMETVFAAKNLQAGIDALVQTAWDQWMKEEHGKVVDDITAIAVALPQAAYPFAREWTTRTSSKGSLPYHRS